MKNYTFVELCKEMLTQSGMPMSCDEIWQKAKETGFDKKIGSTGKTPSKTIAAHLYIDIRDNVDSPFKQVSKRPARFMLKNSDMKISEIQSAVEKVETKEAKHKSDFHERDLHPLLVKFVNINQHFKCYTKTILHENLLKKIKVQINGCTPI